MRKDLRLAENYILLLASLTLGLFLLFFADRSGGVSEEENRMLQPFPEADAASVLSGEYMDSFEAYLSDAFPARKELIALSDSLTGLFGRRDEEAEARKAFDTELGLAGDEAPESYVPPAVPVVEPAENDNPAEPDGSSTQNAGASAAALWLERADGSLEYVDRYPAETVANLAAVLNAYRAALPEDGNIFFIHVPASDVTNKVLETGRYTAWGTDLDEAVRPLVPEDVRLYDAADLLMPYAGEPLFSVGDFHWYVKTAWRVSNAFVDDLGYAPSAFYDYEYYLRYSLSNGPYTPEQLQSMTLERENLLVPLILSPVRTSLITRLTERTPSDVYDFKHHGYTMYLGGAKGPYRLFETGFHTGRNALMISDSYGFSMLYYLFPFYDEVLQTDLRDTNYRSGPVGASIRQYIEEYGIDDVYLVTCHWTSVGGPVFSWRLGYFLDAAPGES